MPSPLIPYIGGKQRLAEQILSLHPKHTCYVEPFAGGSACLFMKEPSKSEVINDINAELIKMYRAVQNHPEEFMRQFKWALSSRKMFEWEKMKNPETLTDIQAAARFFYLQKHAFGGMVATQSFGTSTTDKPRLNFFRLEQDLSDAHLRLARVRIENLTWQETVKRYDRPHTLFFCDPPYWKVAGYGMPFPFSEYEELAEFARTIKGKMIITLNDHPDIRKLFAEFRVKKTDIKYTCGREKKRKTSTEMIICNW